LGGPTLEEDLVLCVSIAKLYGRFILTVTWYDIVLVDGGDENQ
jgi:hypothetical protein